MRGDLVRQLRQVLQYRTTTILSQKQSELPAPESQSVEKQQIATQVSTPTIQKEPVTEQREVPLEAFDADTLHSLLNGNDKEDEKEKERKKKEKQEKKNQRRREKRAKEKEEKEKVLRDTMLSPNVNKNDEIQTNEVVELSGTLEDLDETQPEEIEFGDNNDEFYPILNDVDMNNNDHFNNNGEMSNNSNNLIMGDDDNINNISFGGVNNNNINNNSINNKNVNNNSMNNENTEEVEVGVAPRDPYKSGTVYVNRKALSHCG